MEPSLLLSLGKEMLRIEAGTNQTGHMTKEGFLFKMKPETLWDGREELRSSSLLLSEELPRGEIKTGRADIHPLQNASGSRMDTNRHFTHSFHVSRMC